jgi:class 3 adenylate cyclase/tetratricopeptide (TPR) repeat protein
MVGERRQLTVLFCDLVNYTGLTESLDSEDVAELIIAYQEAGKRIFTKYGGYIAQFLGDGLLVYFGFPEAHEDDAVRSVTAALELLAELDHIRQTHAPGAEELRLEARVGIHTGAAVVGVSAGTERSVIFGETVNIAARLQSMAEPGSVLVSEPTQALLRGGFEHESVGPLALKGVSRKIEAFRVTKAASTDAPRQLPGRSGMVDRTKERQRVLEQWRLAREGACRGLSISGEAGVGKSTLIGYLQSEIANEPHVWLQAQCSAMAEATPLHPFVQMIRRRLGLTEGMPEDEQLDRLRAGLAAADLGAPDQLHLMAQLLELPVERSEANESPEIVRGRTLETLLAWLERIAAQAPVALVCEDMHWSDPSTRELAARLVERQDNLPILCALTHRPHFKFQCAGPVEAITLDGLEQPHAIELAQTRQATLSTEALTQIVARAGGNPLFIEELTKLAAADTAAALPPTLEALLMAHLDRLGPQAKRTAQIAAALGREFDEALLRTALDTSAGEADATIRQLVEQNIVRSDDDAEGAYVFRHALIRDAAYESLLKSERRKIHARIVEALRTNFADRAERQPDLVAFHLNGADQFEEAANLYRTAGRRAAEQAAIDEAATHYRRGLAALAQVKPSPARDELEMSLQILLGNALMGVRGFGSPELLPVWERASALAESLNDANETTSALNGLAVYRFSVGDCHAGVELGEKILSLANARQDRIGRLRAHSTIATALMQIGDGQKALEHANLGIAAYQPGDFKLVTYGVGTDQGLIAYAAAAGAEWWLGRPDAGLERAREGVRLVEQLDSALSLAAGRSFLAMNHWFRREFEVAQQIAEENYAFCERLQFPFWSGFSLLLRASRCVPGSTQALDDANAALEKLAQTASRTGVAIGFIILAEAQRAAGNLDAALGIAGMGLQLCQALRQHFLDAELLRLQGELLAEKGDRGGAETALRAALTEATAKGAQSLRLRSAVSLHRQLNTPESLSLLADARRHIEGGIDTPDMRAALELLR